MKGLIIFCMLFLSFAVQAAPALKGHQIVSLKTSTGKIFKNLSSEDSTKVLESLESDENIELADEIIYPEEVTEVIVGKLTKARIVEKRPNPKDYN